MNASPASVIINPNQKGNFFSIFLLSQIYETILSVQSLLLFFSAMCVMNDPSHRESSHHPIYRYLLVRYRMYNCTDRKLGIDIKGYMLHTL